MKKQSSFEILANNLEKYFLVKELDDLGIRMGFHLKGRKNDKARILAHFLLGEDITRERRKFEERETLPSYDFSFSYNPSEFPSNPIVSFPNPDNINNSQVRDALSIIASNPPNSLPSSMNPPYTFPYPNDLTVIINSQNYPDQPPSFTIMEGLNEGITSAKTIISVKNNQPYQGTASSEYTTIGGYPDNNYTTWYLVHYCDSNYAFVQPNANFSTPYTCEGWSSMNFTSQTELGLPDGVNLVLPGYNCWNGTQCVKPQMI